MPSGSWIHISVGPQGSVAGSRVMVTAAAASQACSAWTSRAWIQIITDCPGGSAVCPDPSSNPGPRKNTTPGIVRGGRTRGRWPGPIHRGRSGGCGPSRWAAGGSGCSERPRDYCSSTRPESRPGTVPPGLVLVTSNVADLARSNVRVPNPFDRPATANDPFATTSCRGTLRGPAR